MKNHLLKTIKQLNKNQYLKKIEFFQSEFIQQDLIIDIFRTDQAQLLQSITLEKNENIKRSASRDNKFLKFRKELRKYELAFIALKFKFYTFLQNIRDND